MPMSEDTRDGGSRAEGSRNRKYFGMRYQKGVFCAGFARPGQLFVGVNSKEQGLGWLQWHLHTSHIPKLGRWKH